MKRLITALVAASLAATVIAAQVGEARAPTGERMLLSDQSGKCQDSTQMAAFVGPGGVVVPGCWFERLGMVWILFADGDAVGLPKALFKFEEI